MSPDALRTGSTAMLGTGIAVTVALFLDLVWPLGAWLLVIVWIGLGIALDLVAERAQLAHETEVNELRRRGL